MTKIVLSQFRGEVVLLASGNDNGAMTNAHRKKNSTAMEQFDPVTQKSFNHAPKTDPFGDAQAEYEHAERVSPFSDLVPNEKQKPAAGAPY
jgi:hypothetical protein